MDRYAKPIQGSRDAKASSRDQEAGALALEALHRQVLPFLLRRLKTEVLADLPPKTIEDCMCDLSPLQVQLYESFSRSPAMERISGSLSASSTGDVQKAGHVFQALQYLKKLCNHPLLVLSPSHPQYQELVGTNPEKLHNIEAAPKLLMLR